ncbi:MAG: 50S ribosomal protein L11 methyltransferase [Planctomycetota bacterium]
MIGLRLIGPEAALHAAIDRILVRCAVAGIEERAEQRDVWLHADSPPLPALDDVAVTRLPPPTAAAADWTAGDAAIEVAPDLVVRPPWVASLQRPGIELVVPRGMAFGSGEHESTRLALLAMREAVRGGSFADIGTGSGILALYGRALGCRPLAACDVEEAAIEAATELVPELDARLGGPAMLQPLGPFDHVVANLRGEELLSCLDAVLALWNGSGAMVLSGLRPHELDALRRRLPARPTPAVHRGERFVSVRLAEAL